MSLVLIPLLAACAPELDPATDGLNERDNVELPQWDVVTSTAQSEVATGYVLLSWFDPDGGMAMVIDGAGSIVWHTEDPGEPYKINRVRLGLDGQSVLYSQYDRDRAQNIAEIVRMDLGGHVLSTTRAVEQHHDFVEHDDGSLTWLSWGYADVRLNVDVLPMASDVLRNAQEGTADPSPQQVYSLLDDYPHEPFWSCGHMAYDHYVPDRYEWSHSNSIAFVEEEDAYFVMVRYWDALLKIDRSGALLWQLGGQFSDFDLPLEEAFRHGHMSDVWSGGALVFDNGDHALFPTSGVAEFAWDESSMTVEKVWDYRDPKGRFISHLGDARRLPGGNTLIAWGPKGEITEVTAAGEVVWEASTTGKVGRVDWLANFPPK